MRYLVFFAAIWTVTGFSGAFAQTDKHIAAIRAEVNLINKNARTYRKVERSVEGISLEGTAATYFLSDKGLKKITAKIYGETFRATVELFYSGEEMVFAFQRLERYDTHVAAEPPPKVAKVIETRVYYSKGKAVRVIDEKKTLKSGESGFTAAEEAMIDLSEKLKAALDPR